MKTLRKLLAGKYYTEPIPTPPGVKGYTTRHQTATERGGHYYDTRYNTTRHRYEQQP